ncbi:arginyl-tRNA synthetase [Hysterangium stoloniferum]|nr:arginyl-tRNA synthetase [Hysterangium stoloniferum]
MASQPQSSTSFRSFGLPEDIPHIPGVTEPQLCILDSFRTAIARRIVEAYPQLTLEKVYDGVDYGKKGVDFTVALPRFKLKGKPDELTKKVTESFKPDAWVESVEAAGPFLHFQVNGLTLSRHVLNQIDRLTNKSPSGQPEYGRNESGKGKKLVIEYSSPNIAKEFHVGHLRSTIIGQFLCNLHRACGWDVTSINYLGDWGTQFGYVAYGFQKYGSQEELAKDPIKHLLDVYVKINADARQSEEMGAKVKAEAQGFFRRMEEGDEEALAIWRTYRDLSLKKYEQEYETLNVAFDVYWGESKVGKLWQDKCVTRGEELGVVETVDGAKLINLEKWKLGKAILRKRDGTSIYLTRDIAGAIERYEKYKFDKMIYVVSAQQDMHLSQFFKVLQLMGFDWADKLEHVNYGLVMGMSTRKGTVVLLSDLIREAASVMHEQMRKNEDKYNAVEDPEGTSREIGITAIKIQDMAAKRINNYTFNWDRMKSFEGDTGPYLQYAHVRLASMARRNPQLLPMPPAEEIKTELLVEPKAREIVMLLASYPDIVKVAMKTREPSGVVTFMFKLAHGISGAWEVLPVKSETDIEKARARLFMFICARDVLGAAMQLLSIKPLERM